jgi:hypothetical protein
MLSHQLGKHLVFGLQLGLQGRDSLFVLLTLSRRLFPEGRGPILKEFLQSPIEDRGLKFLLLAKIGYWHFLDQVPPKDGNILFRGVMLAMLDRGVPSVSLSYYMGEHSISNWGKTI